MLKSLQISGVQLSTNNVSNSQVLEDLISQISLEERIDLVYKDGTYYIKHNRPSILDRDVHAGLLTRKNVNPRKDQQSRPIYGINY